MSEVFLNIVNMSLAASWLIAVIIVLRLVLKKAPKWLMPLFWGVAGLRLILPFSLESSLSLIPSAKPLPEEMLYENTFRFYSGVPVIDEPINYFLVSREVNVPSAEVASAEMVGQDHLMMILGIVWVIGVCVMMLYALLSYFHLKGKVSSSIRYEENVWLSDQITSPFILGVIRPKIFLSMGLDPENEQYVLAHERAHLKRWDHIWKPLGFLILSVYWFNPLVWTAYILLCKDIELACDEKVVAGYEFGEKKAYATALVDCSLHRRIIVACPLAFGEVGVKERVKTVLNYKKPAFWIIIIALVSCVVTGVCFLTSPRQRNCDILIRIPAGAGMDYYYAEEMIWPHGDNLTLLSKSGNIDTDVRLVEVGSIADFYGDEDTTASVFHMGNEPVNTVVKKDTWYRIGVRMKNTDDKEKEVHIEARNVDVLIADRADSDIEKYRTEYIGDAPKVVAIAMRLPYPASYRYKSIEIQSKIQPYGLTVYLDVNDTSSSDDDFTEAADRAFDLIGNLGSITFQNAETNETIIVVDKDEKKKCKPDIEKDKTDTEEDSVLDWMSLELPDGYSIGKYDKNLSWQGGSLILPRSYEVYDEEDVYAPIEWTYSVLIGRIPASSTEVTYSQGAGFPDMSGLPRDNHTDEEYIDTFKVPGSHEQKQWHAIVRKVNHDLYTPSDIDELEKEGRDMENMPLTSDYWEFWFVKEGEDTYYILTLSVKEFTWEDTLKIVGSLKINTQ